MCTAKQLIVIIACSAFVSAPQAVDSSFIVREYVANAYAYLGAGSHIDPLKDWLNKEENGYVRETIKASIRTIEKGSFEDRIDYIPLFSQEAKRNIAYYYNAFVASDKGRRYYVQDTAAPVTECVAKAALPHQQYHWRITHAPDAGAFGNRHGPIYHVGEDTGWLLDGLPVHAMVAGVVRFIQHESSWGTLVVIESLLPDSIPFCSIYGHLSENLNVEVGENVYAGQKIGQIGLSFSLENGGYAGHVHIGVELSPYATAQLTGYAPSLKRFTSPRALVSLVNSMHRESKNDSHKRDPKTRNARQQ